MKEPDPATRRRRQLAVALEYSGEGAPRVTAKGAGETATAILKAAAEHGVPIRSDQELVEVLAQLPLDSEIPEELYRIVAEVIAFAYWIRGKVPAGFSGRR
ncbi:MAG: flagellar protein FhlB [Xanthomonadaceae bacterium]|nr:flagellar protein FhlB [Xanthomonadaceae bacterium]